MHADLDYRTQKAMLEKQCTEQPSLVEWNVSMAIVLGEKTTNIKPNMKQHR